MADSPYSNLDEAQNTESGVAEYALLAPYSWFDTLATPVNDGTPGSSITSTAAHTFKAGDNNGFLKFQLAPDKNSLGGNPVGDKALRKMNVQATIFVPGSYAIAHEQIQRLLNVPLIVLIKDGDCSQNMFYQLGNSCKQAYINPTFTTGTDADGNKGYNVVIDAATKILIHTPAAAPTVFTPAAEGGGD